MIGALYIEREVVDHPRTLEICRRFPDAVRIQCERYGEVFNRKSQNFRLQKRRPALILARKAKNFVLDAPRQYTIGGRRNFYFSHMLNCIYDCRYCFLQGMYRSAHYVLFVNYEDFGAAVAAKAAESPREPSYFFSGYDCDSLALEPVTGFAGYALPLFAGLENGYLELRTKSTQIRRLLERPPLANCIVAYSLAPEPLAQALEHGAPSLQRRLDAIEKLQRHGWPVGLRFDPLIYCHDYEAVYGAFFEQVFARVRPEGVHSVSLGVFRQPAGFFSTMTRLYPEEKLFAGPLERRDGMVSYRQQIEAAMLAFCEARILEHMPPDRVFACVDDD